MDKSCDHGCGDELCGGEDWVELYNPSGARVDLAGYFLSDDGGPNDSHSYRFPDGDGIDPGGFRVLCKHREFVYGIGGDDTVSLWDDKGEMVDTTGRLSKGGVPGNSYARATDGDGAWEYTAVGATTQGSSNDPTGAGTGDVEGGESGGSAFAFSRSELGAAASGWSCKEHTASDFGPRGDDSAGWACEEHTTPGFGAGGGAFGADDRAHEGGPRSQAGGEG